ncbi:hypothetical protein LMH81_15825 [Vibrio lentus]|uniref:hypothetical protein n=1 Tax=Vibrio lentus TaxID=136468 RepID=UPI000C85AD3D|nr:hypothetical protein [Vibrio lentus]MCC4817993.1 hypothetical protein [Vibrio lentus]PML25443.1 hypothetical protein BCT80_19325 [Vibrio lentus]
MSRKKSQLNKRRAEEIQRVEKVIDTLDRIRSLPSLSREIKSLDKLAKKVSSVTGIGYSTLLKKQGQYRIHLEHALIDIVPRKESLSSLSDPEPENWVHQKAIYQSEIGLMQDEIKSLKRQLTQTKLAIETASTSRLTIDSAISLRDCDIKLEKMCRTLALLLDFEELSLEILQDGSIKYFGETIVSAEYMQPYLDWQNRTTPPKVD